MSLKLTQNAKAAMLAVNIPVSEGENWTAEDERNWADYLFFTHGVARHQVPFVFVYPEAQAEPLRSILLSDEAAELAPKAETAEVAVHPEAGEPEADAPEAEVQQESEAPKEDASTEQPAEDGEHSEGDEQPTESTEQPTEDGNHEFQV